MRSEKGQIAQFFVIVFLVFIAFVILAALLGGPSQQAAVSNAMSNIAAELDYNNSANNNAALFSASQHALDTHAEASLIQDCLNKNGPSQVWKDRQSGEFYALCEFKKGTWGLAVCTASGYNKTMFSPDSGSWMDTWKYVFARGTRFTKGLPAGCD